MTANFTILAAGSTEVWTASLEGAPAWGSLSAVSGTGPGSLNINFNTAALAAGTFNSALVLNSGGSVSRQAFTLTVITPNVVKMEADYNRPVIHALHMMHLDAALQKRCHKRIMLRLHPCHGRHGIALEIPARGKIAKRPDGLDAL